MPCMPDIAQEDTLTMPFWHVSLPVEASICNSEGDNQQQAIVPLKLSTTVLVCINATTLPFVNFIREDCSPKPDQAAAAAYCCTAATGALDAGSALAKCCVATGALTALPSLELAPAGYGTKAGLDFRPSSSNISRSALRSLFLVVSSLSPSKMLLAPAIKHSACKQLPLVSFGLAASSCEPGGLLDFLQIATQTYV